MALPRRKVLIVLPSLEAGGAERVILMLLRHFDRRLLDLTLALIDGRPRTLAADLPKDVPIVDLHATRARYSPLRIVRVAWRLKPDVIFCVIGHVNLMLAALKPFLPRRTKLMVRETTVLSTHLAHERFPRLWLLAYRLLLSKCDLVVCQSNDMKHQLDELRVKSSSLTVLPNPVDIDRISKALSTADSSPFVWPGAKHNLVAAGRLVKQKGFDLIIGALAKLDRGDIHVTILGEGPNRAALERLANLNGLTAQVHFVGHQQNPYAYFAAADAFVLCSRYEGMPNVVLEALACGTRVIALPAPGGIDEILRDRPGCIIARDMTAESLAEAIGSFDFHNSQRRVFDLAAYRVEAVTERYAAQIMAL